MFRTLWVTISTPAVSAFARRDTYVDPRGAYEKVRLFLDYHLTFVSCRAFPLVPLFLPGSSLFLAFRKFYPAKPLSWPNCRLLGSFLLRSLQRLCVASSFFAARESHSPFRTFFCRVWLASYSYLCIFFSDSLVLLVNEECKQLDSETLVPNKQANE